VVQESSVKKKSHLNSVKPSMSDLKNSVTPPVFYYQPAGVPMAL